MPLNSVMKHNFSQIPAPRLERSVFDRSHAHKTTFDASWLIPIYVDEVLPGDTFTMRATLFSRLATPIVPFMDNIFLDTFWFFVPCRLLWDGWEAFITGASAIEPGPLSPMPSSYRDISIPMDTFAVTPELVATEPTDDTGAIVNSAALTARCLNYLGLPMSPQPQTFNSMIPHGYTQIYLDWFIDENLQQSGTPMMPAWNNNRVKITTPNPNVTDGTHGEYWLWPRGKRHDYFTSCLPWPQKGPGVEIEIGTDAFAPVVWNIPDGSPIHDQYVMPSRGLSPEGAFGSSFPANFGAVPGGLGRGALASVNPNMTTSASNDVGVTYNDDAFPMSTAGFDGDVYNFAIGDMRNWAADISGVAFTPITINALREAFQLQKMLEKDARGGTRYTEQLRSHFGVISPDARLQRAEYLGGSSQRMYITPVQQTSATDGTSPQGNLAAYGATSFRTGFHKTFVEHGYVYGLINARADITYSQGRNRMWDRKTRNEFYWPTLAHLGEQAVLNKEIYVKGDASDEDVFGYQERWAEYRYKPSLVTGALAPDYPSGIPQWTLCEDFPDTPVLGNLFIRDSSRRRIDRVIATPSEPQFILDSFFDLKCAREMPVYSVPGLVDHF